MNTTPSFRIIVVLLRCEPGSIPGQGALEGVYGVNDELVTADTIVPAHEPKRMFQSILSACTGSILAARHAGARFATTAMPRSVATAPPQASASAAPMP